MLLLATLSTSNVARVLAWSNGGYSANLAYPDYGTHDWIAEHALDWLPVHEKQLLLDNKANFLYGTELPDNKNTPSGIGDSATHHIYFCSDGSIQADSAAVRAKQEYLNARNAYNSGNFSGAAMCLGMVTHYVDDLSVFGHVMGAATVWGAEQHHSDYETYVGDRTKTYTSEFNSYLVFDGALTLTSAYDAAVALARDTTFGGTGGLTCTWMDKHYNWTDSAFRNRAGESLNLAVNAVADVLHTFYCETLNADSSSGPVSSEPTFAVSPSPSASLSLSPSPNFSPSPSPQVTEFSLSILICLVMVTVLILTLGFKKLNLRQICK